MSTEKHHERNGTFPNGKPAQGSREFEFVWRKDSVGLFQDLLGCD